MVRVKICGVTNATDARCAVRSGADVIGLNLYTGPRRVGLERAQAIASVLPPFVHVVVLLGREDIGRAGEICKACGAAGVQLHGFNQPEDAAAWREALEALRGVTVIRPVRVRNEEDVERIPKFPADVYLLDAFVEGKEGGTGKTWDWTLASGANRYGPIMLAGGLSPDNVAEAIRRVRPYAVDVCSGVESAPGKKDRAKMAAFVRNAKTALPR